ncbi:MAG: hypothetical protein ACR2N3_07695 [Pyrinomonadaceae bacterium]
MRSQLGLLTFGKAKSLQTKAQGSADRLLKFDNIFAIAPQTIVIEPL